jgi:hypothetical protein
MFIIIHVYFLFVIIHTGLQDFKAQFVRYFAALVVVFKALCSKSIVCSARAFVMMTSQITVVAFLCNKAKWVAKLV